MRAANAEERYVVARVGVLNDDLRRAVAATGTHRSIKAARDRPTPRATASR